MTKGTMNRRQINRRDALKLGLAGAGGAVAMPFFARNGLAAEPIKLGSLLDGTGALGLEGKRMIETTEYTVELLNKAGGLLGRPIKLIAYDTQSNMQLYTQYAQTLALKDKVDVIQGGITSASREAIRPIFGRSKTLYFYNTQYEGGVCDRNVFCTGSTPAQTVNHIVDYALKNWGKKAYIIAADYNYGHITASWMTKFMKDGGGSVAGTDFFPLDVTNFSSAISRIQQAQPEIVPLRPRRRQPFGLLPAVGRRRHEGQDPHGRQRVRPRRRADHHGHLHHQRHPHLLRLVQRPRHAREQGLRRRHAGEVRRRRHRSQRARHPPPTKASCSGRKG